MPTDMVDMACDGLGCARRVLMPTGKPYMPAHRIPARRRLRRSISSRLA